MSCAKPSQDTSRQGKYLAFYARLTAMLAPMQAFFYFVLTSYYLYITIRRAPMHRTWLNCANAFLALFPWWAASLAFIGVFYHEVRCPCEILARQDSCSCYIRAKSQYSSHDTLPLHR